MFSTFLEISELKIDSKICCLLRIRSHTWVDWEEKVTFVTEISCLLNAVTHLRQPAQHLKFLVCGHESLHKKVYFTNTHWVICECTQFGYVTFLNYVSPSTRLPFKPARHTPRFIFFDKIANFAFLLLSWWIVNFLLL